MIEAVMTGFVFGFIIGAIITRLVMMAKYR